jgi:hypothetical protein
MDGQLSGNHVAKRKPTSPASLREPSHSRLIGAFETAGFLHWV